jgi:retron-type reverse transcriptase
MQKRSTAVIGLRQNSTYSGQNKKDVLSKLDDLHNYSMNKKDQMIDRDLYNKFIVSKELLIYAYNKLKSNPGMMTPGINPTTLDGISDEILDKVINDLKNNSFKFTPVKRILISKPNGGKRPLSLGSPIDKLVQEVMRMVLEAIYEPLFSNKSHGFRRNRSCHSALRYVFTQFKGCT